MPVQRTCRNRACGKMKYLLRTAAQLGAAVSTEKVIHERKSTFHNHPGRAKKRQGRDGGRWSSYVGPGGSKGLRAQTAPSLSGQDSGWFRRLDCGRLRAVRAL